MQQAAPAALFILFIGFVILIELAIIGFVIASLWKVFEKAGEPGWAAIVPIYNGMVFMRICGRPEWWIALCFIPVVGIVVSIMASIDLARRFGQSDGFAVGMIFLPFIFIPILAFGSAQYIRPLPVYPVAQGFPVGPQQ